MGTDVAGFLDDRAALIASAAPGSAAARELSGLTDRAVSALAETALSRLGSPWSVLALGGWGAGRLLPHSDLDLLVLTDAPAAELKPMLAEVLYPLWDNGLRVGHQVRSRRDHLRMCRDDLETLTATLTGRSLCGDPYLAASVLADVASQARKRGRSLTRRICDRERPGSPYLLEPDLKEGAGGQRDLDEITWLGAVLAGKAAAGPEASLEAGLLDEGELDRLLGAADAITSARWGLHRVVTRPTSLLSLDLAEEAMLDLEALQSALADAHHTLLRARGRVSNTLTPFDPRRGDATPLAASALFSLLDRGEPALPDLEEAAWAGLLNDLVPALDELMCARRPALSHAYTVGAHCLRTAALVADEPAARPKAAGTRTPGVGPHTLQFAALVHDLGKAQRGPGHAERGETMARILAPRFGLRKDETDDAALLVREHLLLVETASGHDIHDEDVILRVAARVPRRDLVDGLYRLTVADSLATGPGAWTAWHAALVGELADRLRAALSEDVRGAGIVERAERTRTTALEGLVAQPGAEALSGFLKRASLRYLAATGADEAARHARLAADVTSSGLPGAFEIGVGTGPTADTWRVSVAAIDRPGLFALVCGALALTGLDIMAADAYDAPEGVALDVFIVRADTRATPDTSTWSALERHLRGALLDPAALAVRFAERRSHYPLRSRARTSVAIGETGAYATAVRVRTADRVGLLYDIARAIADCDLQIRWVRAITQDGVARDVFHVTDRNGEPVDDPGLLGHLAMRIRERL